MENVFGFNIQNLSSKYRGLTIHNRLGRHKTSLKKVEKGKGSREKDVKGKETEMMFSFHK